MNIIRCIINGCLNLKGANQMNLLDQKDSPPENLSKPFQPLTMILWLQATCLLASLQSFSNNEPLSNMFIEISPVSVLRIDLLYLALAVPVGILSFFPLRYIEFF